ncbi:hypothetical protein HDU76_002323 [Blyttiomyces sp. JEL0837]|nr:hypothetical protein HDU76_002323 [Blyttiomyces sp. JEL0837]
MKFFAILPVFVAALSTFVGAVPAPNPEREDVAAPVAAPEPSATRSVRLITTNSNSPTSKTHQYAVLDGKPLSPISTKSVNNAFKAALDRGYSDVVLFLLTDRRVNPIGFNNAAITAAAAKGWVNVVRKLLKKHKTSLCGKCGDLGVAAANGHVRVVGMLLRNWSVDANANENYALRMAARNGHVEVKDFVEM